MEQRPRLDVRSALALVGFLLAVILGIGLVGAYFADKRQQREHAEWIAFKAAHHCRAVAHKDGQTLKTVSSDPKGPSTAVTYSTPAQTGWACDDGVTRFVNDE